ncbi:MAG: ABC transporter permease [bacterium]|nr:ABC transporter permease [bacterium]
MLFYIKLAWRNMLRNKRRTIIAAVAMGIGLGSLIVGSSIIRGMSANMVKSVTASYLGEAQIHANGFRETREVERTVKNLETVVKKLDEDPLVDKYALRTVSMGMITSPANANAILLVGVEPSKEKFLSKIDDALDKGDYFEGTSGQEIIIGRKLAQTLEVEVGDRIVATVARAESGELSQEMFRISGIYFFNSRELDTGLAFIRIDKAQAMLGIGKNVHQAAIKFKSIKTASRKDISFWQDYSVGGNEAVSWGTLVPQLQAISEMMGAIRYMMVIILAAVVVFGIINTLFMSLYERMFEFAVMRAVGTRVAGMRKLIVLEAGALAIISIFLGMAIGLGLNFYLEQTGIDYRGVEYAGASFNELLYPDLRVWDLVVYPVGLFVFTLLVGIYPAYVAGKMKLADALRKSL